MLVFISDLHFEDESAGKHNVSADAFSIFFEDLRWRAERRCVKDLRIILLGDIFDLLRTDYWSSVDPEERPWGTLVNRGRVGAHALQVLERIRDTNAATFETFRKGVTDLKEDLQVDVTYVPGNHDRLVNLYPEVRAAARDILGLGDDGGAFPDRVLCPRHGVLALHGHQFDIYNCEKPSIENPDGVSIGEPITTELVVRFPKSVLAAIRRGVPGLSPEKVECIERSFESLEDVRPIWAVVDWLLSHVRNEPLLEAAVREGLDDALTAFKNVPFVQRWFELHDRWADWKDEADQLQWLLWIAGNVSLKMAGKLAPPVMKLQYLTEGADPYVNVARKLLDDADLQTQFVVMGHTHHAKREALGVIPRDGQPPIRRVYLNSGTWRPCHYRCADGSGFLAWKEMTNTMIYAPDERKNQGAPSFETWSGTLDAGESSRCD